MKKVKFDVFGMTCSSCQSHVEKAIKKLDGIKNINVNLISNNMVVEFDDKKINEDAIIKAVVDAGYGAQIYVNKKEIEHKKKFDENIIKMKKRLILSIIFLIILMYVAMIAKFDNAMILALTELILVIPIVILNRNYFIVGFKRFFKRTPNMDSLIAMGSSAAIIYGLFAIFMIAKGNEHYAHDLYFESAGSILTLITVGKYLETKSKGKTNEAITKLINLVPKTATVIRDNKEIEISIDEITENEIVLIKPGSNVPVDGLIIEGSSAIDESSITGESIPVDKTVGGNVISGTVNKNGFLKIKATKVGENTTISQIVKLVEEASNSKAPISKLADKISGIFVPIVILIAVLTTIVWILAGQTFEFALSTGIAVLVISCPCALGLAVPVAIMVGTGKGAENGILIKSAESLELLHKIDTVVLDKTGTITEGNPKVVEVISFMNDEKKFIKYAASIEKKSEHPLALAIIKKAEDEKIELIEMTEFEAISGRGVKTIVENKEFIAGNKALMNENKIDLTSIKSKNEEFEKQGKTVLYFAKEKELIGLIVVADVIKKDSAAAIKAMQELNLNVVMLTGDNKLVANTIAAELDIKNVESELMPQDKEKIVKKLQEEGRSVAFVGDGINDSPALVRADVGIAIGQGTDIAIEAADVVLIKNSLMDVVTSLELGKATMRKIRQNLFWAFFYNIIGIPIAAGILYPFFEIKLSPMVGAAAMSFSSVSVVTSTLLLKRFKSKFKKDEIINNVQEENKKMSILARKTITIEGMHCNHCKMAVEKTLKKLEGVVLAEVDLEKKIAVVEYEGELENDTIKEVITEEGFEVVKIEE